MNSLKYFILAMMLVVLSQQSNTLNTPGCLACRDPFYLDLGKNLNNLQSEQVRKTINGINENFKQFEHYGGFIDAKIALRNGYVDAVNSVAVSENAAAKALAAAEGALSLNQAKVAADTIQQEMLIAENALYDAGVVVLQCLGDGLALSNDNTRLGLAEASQIIQRFGLDVNYQMNEAVSTTRRATADGWEPAHQALLAARQALNTAFTVLYDWGVASHQRATKSITDAQNAPILDHAANLNADAAARDPDTWATISEINKAAADSVAGGASADKVIRLKNLLVSSVGDFARIASDERQCLENVQKLDALVGEQVFRKQFEELTRQTQNTISNVFLSYSSAGHNYDSASRRKLGLSMRSMEVGNVEVTSGKRTAFGLTVVGLRLPRNLGSLVIRAADESYRQGKVAILRRMVEGARIAFNVL